MLPGDVSPCRHGNAGCCGGDGRAGVRNRQNWEVFGRLKKKTPQPHTLSLSHSLTPPCAAKLHNDVIVVGEKQHNLCPSCRGEGREGCTTFFLISPCSLPSNSPWGGKVEWCTGIWGANISPRLCLGYGIPRISSPPWTGFLSPLQGGP